MIMDFPHLSPRDTLSRAVELVLVVSQQDFTAVYGSRIFGILPRAELILALADHGREMRVGDLKLREFESSDIDEPLQSACGRLHSDFAPVLPVARNGQPAGIITAKIAGEFLMFRAPLGARTNAMAGSAWHPCALKNSHTCLCTKDEGNSNG
jgi:hypothetical protein